MFGTHTGPMFGDNIMHFVSTLGITFSSEGYRVLSEIQTSAQNLALPWWRSSDDKYQSCYSPDNQNNTIDYNTPLHNVQNTWL